MYIIIIINIHHYTLFLNIRGKHCSVVTKYRNFLVWFLTSYWAASCGFENELSFLRRLFLWPMFTSNTSDMACNYIQEKPKHRMTKTRSHTFHLASFQDVIHTLLIALKLKRNERFLIDIFLNIILLLKTKTKNPINSVKNVLIFNFF